MAFFAAFFGVSFSVPVIGQIREHSITRNHIVIFRFLFLLLGSIVLTRSELDELRHGNGGSILCSCHSRKCSSNAKDAEAISARGTLARGRGSVRFVNWTEISTWQIDTGT